MVGSETKGGTVSDDTVTIDPSEFDLEDFAIGDLLTVQEELGVDITNGKAFVEDLSPLEQMQAIVFLFKRQRDPSFGWEDTRRIKLGDLNLKTSRNGREAEPEDPT